MSVQADQRDADADCRAVLQALHDWEAARFVCVRGGEVQPERLPVKPVPWDFIKLLVFGRTGDAHFPIDGALNRLIGLGYVREVGSREFIDANKKGLLAGWWNAGITYNPPVHPPVLGELHGWRFDDGCEVELVQCTVAGSGRFRQELRCLNRTAERTIITSSGPKRETCPDGVEYEADRPWPSRYFELTDAGWECLRGPDGDGAASPTGNARTASRGKRRGRKPDTDPKADRQVAEAWSTGRYSTYAELDRERRAPSGDSKRAIDRHRHRKRQ